MSLRGRKESASSPGSWERSGPGTRENGRRKSSRRSSTRPGLEAVVDALGNLAPGGRLVVNAIRKEDTDKDSLLKIDYASDLWLEKEVKSVANVTRADVAEFLRPRRTFLSGPRSRSTGSRTRTPPSSRSRSAGSAAPRCSGSQPSVPSGKSHNRALRRDGTLPVFVAESTLMRGGYSPAYLAIGQASSSRRPPQKRSPPR